MIDPNLKYLDTGFLPTDRVILHADCNSFFASVESIGHPEYTKVPMAVCGDPKSRHGIILAKNELAKAYHIETAEEIQGDWFTEITPNLNSLKVGVTAGASTPDWLIKEVTEKLKSYN